MEIPHEFLPVLLVQIALFCGLWMVLKRLWIEPALRVIAAREKRSHGAVAEAAALQAEAERLRHQHETALERARSEAHREVQEMLRQAEGEQRRLIDEATAEADRTIAAARAAITQEVATARDRLRADVRALAGDVAKAVLGRAV